jgi:hypothetical protein
MMKLELGVTLRRLSQQTGHSQLAMGYSSIPTHTEGVPPIETRAKEAVENVMHFQKTLTAGRN